MTKPVNATTATNRRPVEVGPVRGGWTSVKYSDGTEIKVRNGMLKKIIVAMAQEKSISQISHQSTKETNTMATAKKAPKTKTVEPTSPMKPAKVTKEMPVKQPKEKKVPVRKPAHFVGEVNPGKTAKIGGSEFDVSRYFVGDNKTPSGRRTIDCADPVAEKLRGMDMEQVYVAAAETLNTTAEELKERYKHLNIGMQRMNIGNRIRGAVAKLAATAA